MAYKVIRPMGDDEPRTLRQTLNSEAVSTSSAILLTYHGYKRTNSVLWAMIYGLAGRVVPLVSVPVALAQGLGKKKEGCP